MEDVKKVIPVEMDCPYCQERVITDVEEVPKRLTVILTGLMCLFCCFCCIPGFMLMDGTREAQHRCPKCDELLDRVSLKGMTLRELRDEIRKEKKTNEKKKKKKKDKSGDGEEDV